MRYWLSSSGSIIDGADEVFPRTRYLGKNRPPFSGYSFD